MRPVLLQAPDARDCEIVRGWRMDLLPYLRTPIRLTEEQQRDFYHNVVCDRRAPHRYFSMRKPSEPRGELLAFGGLTNIEWENGHAEISLVTNPERRGEGIGRAAVDALLHEAFRRLRLQTVFGEVYLFNPACDFWKKILREYKGDSVCVPRRKFFKGTIHGSMLFWFTP